MNEAGHDTPLRMAAFAHVRRLSELHDPLTATELKPGFVFQRFPCGCAPLGRSARTRHRVLFHERPRPEHPMVE